MHWIDIGANLTHESFHSDREQVIERARSHGVAQMIVTGADVASSRAALELARHHRGVLFATAGVHPHHASALHAAELPTLRELLTDPAVVAVGECGLDYFRNFSPRDAQLRAFEWQLELAADCGKPLFLHQRDAHADFVAVLRTHGIDRGRLPRTIAHCFTGDERELSEYLQLGLSIGVTGWFCDERRGAHLHSLVSQIPTGRLMLETDAPYLLPRDLNPKPTSRRNEPMHLPHIGAAVARARGESLEHCAAHTTRAAKEFFGLPTD